VEKAKGIRESTIVASLFLLRFQVVLSSKCSRLLTLIVETHLLQDPLILHPLYQHQMLVHLDAKMSTTIGMNA
jgi:hypothetical protein